MQFVYEFINLFWIAVFAILQFLFVCKRMFEIYDFAFVEMSEYLCSFVSSESL